MKTTHRFFQRKFAGVWLSGEDVVLPERFGGGAFGRYFQTAGQLFCKHLCFLFWRSASGLRIIASPILNNGVTENAANSNTKANRAKSELIEGSRQIGGLTEAMGKI